MIDLASVRRAFNDLQDLQPLSDDTGQRVVLSGMRQHRTVVLKLLRPGQDPARTQREIDAVARLKSDRVPALLDHGKRAIGPTVVFYTIEQRIDGETLQAHLKKNPRPDLSFVVEVGEALLEACAEFEAGNVVHRDLKPGNLIVDRAGKLWIIDFGIARVLDLPSLTGTSSNFGVFTPGYGAPEQIRNFKVQINSRADLFSIGVVLYEMLVGRNPYLDGARDVMDVLRRMLNADLPIPTDPRDTNGELGLFITNMASRFPSRRPQNTKEAREWHASIRKDLGV